MARFTFMVLVSALFLLIRSLIVHRTALAAENLALRQQLAILNRKIHRPQLRRRDRFFWVILSRLWKKWREVLIIVKPETVIKWHRQGFKLYWRWKSKATVGRPKIDKEIRELINPSRNRTSFAGQNHRHPTSRRPASSVSSCRVTLAPLPVLTIIPLRSIEDGLLRRDSYASLQTGHQLSTIQIATTKRKLASAQSKSCLHS